MERDKDRQIYELTIIESLVPHNQRSPNLSNLSAKMDIMINVATLWLINEKNELLLARRADDKKQDPGLWGPSVTGKVEPGETVEEALLKETEEELSLIPNRYIPEFLFEKDFNHPDGETRRFSVYIARLPSSYTNELSLDKREVAEIKWLTINETKELIKNHKNIIVPSAELLWNAFFDKLEQKLL